MSKSVSLRKVTAETVVDICSLKVAPEQEDLVAPNALSIAQAHFDDKAWFRAIYAGEEPVGFIMLSADEPNARYSLWRLMVADGHQKSGHGKRAIELLIEHIRTLREPTALLTSYVPGDRSPGDFYKKLGFVDTGEIDEGEIVCRLALGS